MHDHLHAENIDLVYITSQKVVSVDGNWETSLDSPLQ